MLRATSRSSTGPRGLSRPVSVTRWSVGSRVTPRARQSLAASGMTSGDASVRGAIATTRRRSSSLFVHELLLCLSIGVEVHPAVPGLSKRPDFLVTPANGEPFYVEAVAVSGKLEAELGAEARLAVVNDELNKLRSTVRSGGCGSMRRTSCTPRTSACAHDMAALPACVTSTTKARTTVQRLRRCQTTSRCRSGWLSRAVRRAPVRINRTAQAPLTSVSRRQPASVLRGIRQWASAGVSRRWHHIGNHGSSGGLACITQTA